MLFLFSNFRIPFSERSRQFDSSLTSLSRHSQFFAATTLYRPKIPGVIIYIQSSGPREPLLPSVHASSRLSDCLRAVGTRSFQPLRVL